MSNVKVYFGKLREDVIIPSRRDEDAAFDIYANFEEDYKVIMPNETMMIPTGLVSAFALTHAAIFKERGSTGSKGIGQRCGVIDSGYRGEWFVPLTNHTNKVVVISKDGKIPAELGMFEILKGGNQFILYPYDKAICQCMMVEVPQTEITELSVDEIKAFKSERGEGALGSSNK